VCQVYYCPRKLGTLEYDIEQKIKKQQFIDDATILRLLHDAGATYTAENRDAFQEVLSKQPFSSYFGKCRIQSVEFRIHSKEEPTQLLLTWVVELEVLKSGGGYATYVLYYEPFEGTLCRLESAKTGVKGLLGPAQ